MKIMIVFGTRPEVIKLAPLMAEFRHRSPSAELIVCSTGQHKEMLIQAMGVFGITPDEDLAVMQCNQTLADLTARLITGMDQVLRKHQPDVVMVQGDTTTAFIAALAAFYQGMPVAHVEAGLRTGNLASPFPEEGNRVLIGRLATWHFAPTVRAATQLLAEGVPKEQVQNTGNTIVDAIEMIKVKWRKQSYEGKETRLFPAQKLVLVTTHRRENFGIGLKNICQAVRQLSNKYPDHGFVLPVHLNPNVAQTVHQELGGLKNIKLIAPVNFEASLYLQSRACLILTDSGGVQEESPSFGVPCVVMRQHTERIEGISAGFAYLAGTDAVKISQLAEDCLSSDIREVLKGRVNPYGDGQSAKRIVDRLMADMSLIKNLT